MKACYEAPILLVAVVVRVSVRLYRMGIIKSTHSSLHNCIQAQTTPALTLYAGSKPSAGLAAGPFSESEALADIRPALDNGQR